MATFDSLAGDQRAVLRLVLARRRGYEEIARTLSLAPEVVSGRALRALEALAPPDELDAGERRLVCGYLLSQPARLRAECGARAAGELPRGAGLGGRAHAGARAGGWRQTASRSGTASAIA
jgi:hypothetical protein